MKTIHILLLGAFFLPGIQATAGVTISSPSNGAVVTSPFQLVASSQWSSNPRSMSVYVNDVLVLQDQAASSINTTLTLNAGTSTIRVLAQYQRYRLSSASINITVAAVTPPPAPTPLPAGTRSAADQIAADMQGANEGYPHGVPLSYDWANGPVIDMGNNSAGEQAITSWGVVYVAAQGNPAGNTRVNIKNLQLYFLQKNTGKWLLLQNTSTPDGEAYPENFQGNSIPADIRTEPDGTISVTAGNGYNFHFYPSDRAAINPKNIGGIVAIFEARLIVGNPALADDRSIAQYLCSAGADYYPSVTGPGIQNNPSVGNGKMKYVESQWRSFAMTTLTKAQLESNPPPVNLSGILP